MDPVRRADGRNVYWYARNRVTSSTDPQGLTAVGGATLHGIGGAFLDLLFPRGVACASFCGGHFYGGSIPPWGGFKEGIFFGVLWSDKGNCEQGSLKVHVRLIYTTLTFLDDGSTVCEPTAEREFRDGQVIPKARFVTPIAKQKCRMINDGQMQRSPSWPQLPNPPDCSSVTFGWDCDIECQPKLRFAPLPSLGVLPIVSGKECFTPTVKTEIVARGSDEHYYVRHGVAYGGSCCETTPCSANLEFKERIGFVETGWGCWGCGGPGRIPGIPNPSSACGS